MPGYRSNILVIGLCLLLSLQVSGFEPNTPPGHYGLVANLVIRAQQQVFWLARKALYPEMSFATVDIQDETYSYLIRKGEREGTIVLLHGIMGRKDHFMPMVHHWVKMKKPLPTIIAVDLMGHGSHDYPADYDFSVENFTRHTARFIRHIQQQNSHEPFVILGHSLGGGVAALLRPLENIVASALILISPAGVGTTNTTDFKSRIETARGLPFDFGSASICQILEVSFEERRTLTSVALKTGCFFYSFLDCPYETWMKNKMFADLTVSEQQLLSRRSDREYITTHFQQPILLVWTTSDQMFDVSRFISMGEFIVNNNQGERFEFEGSHAWPLEHPDQAAALVDSLCDKALSLATVKVTPAVTVADRSWRTRAFTCCQSALLSKWSNSSLFML